MIIECKDCSATVDAREIATHESGGGSPNDPSSKWTFLACPRCESAMLSVQEDYGAGFDEDTPYRVYPPRERNLGASVPTAIRTAFDEARVCFASKAYTASAIMCRKTLEGMCEHHGAKARNLSASLKQLKDAGVIEARLFEWAEALRTLGNEAAHGVSVSISRADAEDNLQFTEALAQYIFTYRDQFERFKERRTKGKK